MEQAQRKPIVAVTRTALPGDGIPGLADLVELRTWSQDRTPTRDDLLALTEGAIATLGPNGDRIDAAFLDARPDLELLAVASAGYDTIDAAAAAERGIRVTNTPGVLHEATADMAFGLILAARRRIAEADRWTRAGKWERVDLRNMVGHDVHGATLGIIGLGEIGTAVARRGTGFDMTIVHHSRTRGDTELSRWLPLEELLETADIVSIHAPISDETRGLIGEAELRRMKPTATLVNAGRGGIVDETVLVTALREGWIASAGLDVQEKEPNPDPNDPLLSVDSCVVVPHIGSATHAARAAMFDLAAANVRAWLSGEPLLTPVPETRALAGDPPAA